MIHYPQLSPTIVSIGPLHLRWYGLMYVLGLFISFFIIKRLSKFRMPLSTDDILNLIVYNMVGILVGGRLGYILVYDLPYYLMHPLDLFAFWKGGMSYHGGALGCVIATLIFSKVTKKNMVILLDYLVISSSIGIGFGRIGNFINGELYGRISTVPWAMIFPLGGPDPRHPSQLYESICEGFLMFFLLYILYTHPRLKLKDGSIFGLYFIFYGSFRFILEFFREPDKHLGFILGSLTMGQCLCLGMVVFGLLWIWKIRNKIFPGS